MTLTVLVRRKTEENIQAEFCLELKIFSYKEDIFLVYV